MEEFEVRTDTSFRGGVFKHGEIRLNIDNSNQTIPIPAKTTPVKHCTSKDDVFPSTKQISEVYKTVDSTDLRNLINGNNPGLIEDIKYKQRYSDDALNIVLINYKDTQPMTELEAREYVKFINEVSDVITSPLQTPLLYAVIDDHAENPVDDPYHNYKITKENFLDAATGLDDGKPVMGTLSFIPNGKLNQLLKLYDDFDVDMIGVDFVNENPTGTSERFGDVIGRISALDLFAGNVMFAYNMKRSQYRSNADIRTAENFAPVGMGFDIVGGNHLGLGYAPDGEQLNYSVFDPDVVGYTPVSVDTVVDDWPVTVQSNIPAKRVASFQLKKANKLISLINAEQIQLSFNELRERIQQGNESKFLKMKKGIGDAMQDAFKDVRTACVVGSEPSPGDY